jgi:hypothetical protein
MQEAKTPFGTRVKEFWVRSYTSDKKAFFAETVASVAVVVGNTTLAFTANHPPMYFIYPINFLSAVFSIYAYRRRGLAWPLVITGYFIIMQWFGFGRSLGWW